MMSYVKCQQCGTEFPSSPSLVARGNGKYCSKECQGIAKRTRVEKKCLTCGDMFLAKPSDINRGGGKYCSQKCYSESQKTSVKRLCGICGEEFIVSPSRIADGGGKYCSIKCRGLAIKGENHHNWKGGVSPENHYLRTNAEYGEWRKSVLARDNWTCQDCGDKACKGRGQRVPLQTHHIFSFSDFPEYRYEVWNGVTLCEDCHAKYHPAMATKMFNRESKKS